MLILFSNSDTQLERVVILFVCSARWYEDGMKSVFSWNQNMFLCVSFLCRRYCSEQHSPSPRLLWLLWGIFYFAQRVSFYLPSKPTLFELGTLLWEVGSLTAVFVAPSSNFHMFAYFVESVLCVCVCVDLYTFVSFGKRKCKSELDYTGHRSREGLCG